MAKRRGQVEIDDGPTEADLERFGDVTRSCPSCQAEIYDDVAVCWKCGHALMARDRRGGPKGWHVAVIVVLVVAFVILVLANVWR
ncbi:MAG: hypothetical protein IPK69_07505 [Phycisphaerales bacterium]|nr:MAG: hypothetical protein IPK69_07505 [Phycisphaerales bacterium]